MKRSQQIVLLALIFASIIVALIFLSSSSTSNSSSSPEFVKNDIHQQPKTIRIEKSVSSSSSSKNDRTIINIRDHYEVSHQHHHQHYLAGYSGEENTMNKWRPSKCMNWFDSFPIVKKVKTLINWTTPMFQDEVFFPERNRMEKYLQEDLEADASHVSKLDRTRFCSFWETGRFAKEFVESSVFSSSKAFYRKVALTQVPAACSGSNNTKLYHQERECSTGVCLAHSLANLVKTSSSSATINTNNKKNTKNSKNKNHQRPAFLLMIGDSRVRNLFQRLIMMIRSNKRNGVDEMNRTGVADNYWHQNSTYVIYRKSGKDKITILPFGVGCDSDEYVVSKKYSSSDDANNDDDDDNDPVLFMMCLVWHFRTIVKKVNNTAWDIDVEKIIEKSRPDSVVWMPTLHDCVRKRCDTNAAHIDHLNAFARMLIFQLDRRRTIQNKLIFMTTPSASWATPTVIDLRNGVLKKLALSRAIAIDQIEVQGANADNDENNNNNIQNEQQNMMIIRKKKGFLKSKLKVVDAAEYIRRKRPVRCDRVHNMCNFRPIMKEGNVTHFRTVCGGCTDIPDYCIWMQLRRALV